MRAYARALACPFVNLRIRSRATIELGMSSDRRASDRSGVASRRARELTDAPSPLPGSAGPNRRMTEVARIIWPGSRGGGMGREGGREGGGELNRLL